MALSLCRGLTLFFARHGQTEANVQKRFQGRTVDTPLTKLGEQQARDLGAILRREVGLRSALVFVSSPLRRARTTMEIVRGELDLSPEGYATDDRLQEIDLGRWDGLTDAEVTTRDPELYHARAADKWHVRLPGGENYADVATRAESWIADLKADTFAVTHGGFTRILRGLFGGMGWKQMSDLDEPHDCVFRVRDNVVERRELH